MVELGLCPPFDLASLPHGAVLGTVQLVDVTRDADSPWALSDHYHWLLSAPQPFTEPIRGRGALGL
jgi:hypothetical protein